MFRLILPALFLLAVLLALPGCKTQEPPSTTGQNISRPTQPKIPPGAITRRAG